MFSDAPTQTPIRVEPNGAPVMPEWSDADPKPVTAAPIKASAKKTARKKKVARKRVPRDLQPDASQMDSVTQAATWLKAHPEEAAMLRAAQISATGDILMDSGVDKRYYSSTEAAAFFDKTVQWLYWGMRHPPHGGRLFIEPTPAHGADGKPLVDDEGNPVYLREVLDENEQPVLDDDGEPIHTTEGDGPFVMRDIHVERLGDPVTGKRRFDIATIRKFATSAYHQANIKEPKLRAVLERLVVAERGGNWKSIPIPKRQEDTDGPD